MMRHKISRPVKKSILLTMTVLTAFVTVSCGRVQVTYAPAGSNENAVPNESPEKEVEPAKEQTDEPQDEKSDDSGGNLIPSGEFNEDNSAWGLYTESGGSADYSVSSGRMVLHISDPGRVGHAVQLYCGGFEMLEGAGYTFSAQISSDVERTFEWRIQLNGGDYHPYVDVKEVHIGPDSGVFSCDFTMEDTSDPAPRMCFNLGDEEQAQGLGAHDIYIDNVTLTITDDSNAKKVEKMGELFEINLNQIGYRPKDEKRAVIRDIGKGDESFEVIDTSDGKSVFKGPVTEGITKGTSGDRVCYADFSALTTPGSYRIKTEKSGESYEFTISDDVYADALTDSLRMLYLQRCGCELTKEEAGDFAHRACHTEEALIYGEEGSKDVSGGWHDAGDYGRYSVPAAKAVADILLAYENYPDSFGKNDDVLGEARYELEWLLKMQSDDGGVYHKVTGKNFDGFIMSDECTETLYLLPVSKTATADFAGVMYMAARIYGKTDKEFAKRCKDAADRALDAYIVRRDERNFTNPKDVNTGEYGDGCSEDEYLWAICEGYKTTGDKSFEEKLATVDLSRIKNDDFGWEDMSGYAYYAFLTADERMKTDLDLEGRFFAMCDKHRDTALSGEAYGCTISDDYPWGSNMYIANNAMGMLMAGRLTGKGDYDLAAKRQLDYLFGTNSNSYCFFTGYGTQSPLHPHHRPSQAVGECMKGMLVGGPDSALEDPYAKTVLSGLPKARCYADNDQSYSCNEITIYWNSPLVYILAAFR